MENDGNLVTKITWKEMGYSNELSPIFDYGHEGDLVGLYDDQIEVYRLYIPELMRMAVDPRLFCTEIYENLPHTAMPFHAWRLLARFQATEAIETLCSLLTHQDLGDMQLELPLTLSQFEYKKVAPVFKRYLRRYKLSESGFSVIANTLIIYALCDLDPAKPIKFMRAELKRYCRRPCFYNSLIAEFLCEQLDLDSCRLVKRIFEKEEYPPEFLDPEFCDARAGARIMQVSLDKTPHHSCHAEFTHLIKEIEVIADRIEGNLPRVYSGDGAYDLFCDNTILVCD